MSGIGRWIRERSRNRPPSPVPGPMGWHLIIPGPFHPRLYSYWPNAVMSADGYTMVFAGKNTQAEFYRIFPDGGSAIQTNFIVPLPASETEGWYWGVDGSLFLIEKNILRRIDRFGQSTAAMRLEDPYASLWQCHSSEDMSVHSGTIRLDNGAAIGTAVNYRGEMMAFTSDRQLDESQISKDGEWLIIKETDKDEKLWNQIVELKTRQRYELPPGQSIGHSDWGSNFIIGADAWEGYAVKFNPITRARTKIFQTWNMGHVSVRGDLALWSRQELGHIAIGSVNDFMTPPKVIYTHGETKDDDYDLQVRANLSPCGKRAVFTLHGDLHVMEII